VKKTLNQIYSPLVKLLKKKSKGLHDPLFKGNEKKYLKQCIDTGFVSSVGKFVIKFEKLILEYVNSKYAVATNSGTSALHLILKYYKISNKDEVLLPSLTYVATANAVMYCGAIPNFVDVDDDTLGVSPKKLEKYLKKSTKKKNNFSYNKKTGKKIAALIAVHLYGLPCKIDEIKKICKKFNIILIEDAAEAMGSLFKGKHLGTFGQAGILSFNGNKPITCGGGGMIITDNKNLAKKTLHLSTHAKKSNKPEHHHDDVGFNYRMTNLSAAVGCAQLEKIDQILNAKRKNYIMYSEYFKNNKYLSIFKEPINSKSNYWLVIGTLPNNKIKNDLLKLFRKKNIICRSIWRPLHTLRIFKKFPKDNLYSSQKIFKKAFNLPSSPSLNYKIN